MILAVMVTLLLAQAAPSPAASGECSHEADVLNPQIPDAQPGVGSPDLFAIVAVKLAPDASVESVKVFRSSGSLSFDEASLRAAHRSTYKPKVVDCKPVESVYYFKTSMTQGYQPGPKDTPTAPPWPANMTTPPPGAQANTNAQKPAIARPQ
jgi:hypothetical protein